MFEQSMTILEHWWKVGLMFDAVQLFEDGVLHHTIAELHIHSHHDI
jgi:hypothetical protein